MNVVSRRSGSGLAIIAKQPFELLEQVRLRAEMAEMLAAPLGLLGHYPAHLHAVVAMKGVSLDVGSRHLLPAEDVLESLLHRRRSGARRPRDRNDWMTARHVRDPQRNKPRRANNGASLLSNRGSAP